MTKRILALDPGSYRRHPIHGEGRTWAETNCYVDVWIELLHALDHEPVASLPFTLTIDFEGDQWTFFKCPLVDIRDLYGLDVQELAIWRPLAAHIEEQIDRGRPVLVELDSYFLPDTAGTAYKLAHTKSTVAVNEIDIEARHMGYFHGPGYFHVEGEDFLDVLRLRGEPDPAALPPYVEFVKIRSRPAPDASALVPGSLGLLRKHLALVPIENPFLSFKGRFEGDLDWLLRESLDTFHQYSFATLRQYGACFELTHTYLRWLAGQGEHGLEEPIAAFREISDGAKAFQFQLARAMSRRKPLDLTPLEAMAESWERGVTGLRQRYL
jgi:hypothetical protein